MHGLQTAQSASFGPLFHADMTSGTAMIKVNNYYTVDSPLDLSGGLFNGEISTSSREFWVKRYYNIHYFVNTFSYPCIMSVTRLRARTSIPKNATFTSVETAMDDILTDTNAVATITAPFISNLTSPTLHKWFKISSKKTWTMLPGKMYRVKNSIQRRYINRPLQRIAEGNTNDYVLCKGSTVVFVEFNGFPMFNQGLAGGTAQTTLGGFRVVSVNKFYASYYNMDEAVDSNQVYNYLPATQGNGMSSGFPTCYTQVEPRNAYDAEPHSLVATSSQLSGSAAYMGTTSGSSAWHTVTP